MSRFVLLLVLAAVACNAFVMHKNLITNKMILRVAPGGNADGPLGKPKVISGEFDNFASHQPTLEKNRNQDPWVQQRQRPRRNRKSEVVRGLVRENIVTAKDFIYPLFIHEADHKEEISSMPDCFRHSLKTMMEEVGEAMK